MQEEMNLDYFAEYAASFAEYQMRRENMAKHGGRWLRQTREESGESLRSFAERIRVEKSFLSKIERGLEVISPEIATRIVDIRRHLPYDGR